MEIVGKSTPLSIEYRDQEGALMIVPPVLDAAPVWTSSNEGVATLTPATDEPTALANALEPGRDIVHVEIEVDGKKFHASRPLRIVNASHQVLTTIEIVAGEQIATPPPPAPVSAAPSSGSTSSGATTSGTMSSGSNSSGSPPLNAEGLRTDGPTLEAYEAAGYSASNYPPVGYAEKPSPGLTAYLATKAASLGISTGSTSTGTTSTGATTSAATVPHS